MVVVLLNVKGKFYIQVRIFGNWEIKCTKITLTEMGMLKWMCEVLSKKRNKNDTTLEQLGTILKIITWEKYVKMAWACLKKPMGSIIRQ